jgi:hypothetical protein
MADVLAAVSKFSLAPPPGISADPLHSPPRLPPSRVTAAALVQGAARCGGLGSRRVSRYPPGHDQIDGGGFKVRIREMPTGRGCGVGHRVWVGQDSVLGKD